MKEKEYVNTVNLAKLRCALDVLRHVVPDENTKEVADAIRLLYKSHDRLERIVTISPG